jgi:hypothetical protein
MNTSGIPKQVYEQQIYCVHNEQIFHFREISGVFNTLLLLFMVHLFSFKTMDGLAPSMLTAEISS